MRLRTPEFHIDRCDVVALLCLQRAKSGGLSTSVSSMTVHNSWPRSARLLDRCTNRSGRPRRGSAEGKAPSMKRGVQRACRHPLGAVSGCISVPAQRFPSTPAHREDIEALDI